MARADGDVVLAGLGAGEEGAGLGLGAGRPVAAGGVEAEDVVAVARDDVDGRGGVGRLLEAGVDAEELAQPDDVFIVVIHFEDPFVVGAGLAPQVAPSPGRGGRDQVAEGEPGEPGCVQGGGVGHRLREVGGDGDDGDAVAR